MTSLNDSISERSTSTSMTSFGENPSDGAAVASDRRKTIIDYVGKVRKYLERRLNGGNMTIDQLEDQINTGIATHNRNISILHAKNCTIGKQMKELKHKRGLHPATLRSSMLHLECQIDFTHNH